MQAQLSKLKPLEGIFKTSVRQRGTSYSHKISAAANSSVSSSTQKLLVSSAGWRPACTSLGKSTRSTTLTLSQNSHRSFSTLTLNKLKSGHLNSGMGRLKLEEKTLNNLSISNLSKSNLNKAAHQIIRYNQTSSSSSAAQNQSEEVTIDVEPKSGDKLDAEEPPQNNEESYHNIIKNSETATGESEKLEFQAETRMLLDIVAKSLYSETEIFVRELISNASDALEKFRYLSLAGDSGLTKTDRPLEIHLGTDKVTRCFTIQDTGIGMTKEEMIENLGTIAKSGSKAFIESLKDAKGRQTGQDPSAIIGQFGVGFYSSFMVANKVEVFSRSSKPDSKGYKWTSDGSGTYEIQEAEGVQEGTKIVVHLKGDCRSFSDEQTIKDIVKKYSSFVGSPIFLNGTQINTLQALWLMDPKSVSKEQHDDFYRFVAGSYDRPRFTLHFKTEVPLSLRCLLYVPEGKPGLFEAPNPGKDSQIGVSLYSRKILIKNKADNIIPMWLRFMKGAVDSEDIPLNLSRELLQEGSLIRKLKTVVTNRCLRFLQERAKKEPEEYAKFYADYGIYLKEGIIQEQEQVQKEEIGKLLRFESSLQPAGALVSLPEYISRMQAAQKDIYYLAAPSRHLAESSPYLEALKEKNQEVLFCFEPYDEVVLLQLRQFDMKSLTSVEKEMRQMKDTLDLDALPIGSLPKAEAESLVSWLSNALKGRASVVKLTQKLDTHPCVVTVDEMGSARHFVRTQFASVPADSRYSILQPHFEINVKHPLIKKLSVLKDSDSELATLLAEQLFANAMVTAGLEMDPRSIVGKLNELLTKAVEKL